MKAWPLILISTFLGFLIYYLLFVTNIEIKLDKILKYKGCEIRYKHSYANYGGGFEWKQHIENNNYLEEVSAKYKLIKCLCDKFIIIQDSSIRDYIENFYNNNEQSQFNYYTKLAPLDTILLMTHCKEIFKVDYDTRWYDSIDKYIAKDSLLLIDILIVRFHENHSIKRAYFNYLKYKTKVNPSIETLIKYKDVIFNN